MKEESLTMNHGVTTFSVRFLVANNSWVVMREDADRITFMETFKEYVDARKVYDDRVSFFNSVVGG